MPQTFISNGNRPDVLLLERDIQKCAETDNKDESAEADQNDGESFQHGD